MNLDIPTFADQWQSAWNDHDLDRLLAHFSDDVTFESPIAATLVDGSHGVLRGKSALRSYWSLALELIPDLKFTLVGVYGGLNVVVINYRNQRDNLVCEVLRLQEGLVVEGHGAYLSDGLNDPGAAVGVSQGVQPSG